MTTRLDTPRDAATAVPSDPTEVAAAVDAAIALADARGRDDLADRLRVIAERVAGPTPSSAASSRRQERADQRAHRQRRLPGRRRPRHDGRDRGPPRERARSGRSPARGRRADRGGVPPTRPAAGSPSATATSAGRCRARRGGAPQPIPRPRHRPRRHARCRWSQRGPRRRDARLPSLGRRPRLRDRRVDRAVEPGARVPRQRAVRGAADPRGGHQGRHLPGMATDRRDRRRPARGTGPR